MQILPSKKCPISLKLEQRTLSQRKKRKSPVVAKKRKQENSDINVIEFSEKSSVEYRPNRKYGILHGKKSYSKDNCKNLCVMVNNHKQKKEKL